MNFIDIVNSLYIAKAGLVWLPSAAEINNYSGSSHVAKKANSLRPLASCWNIQKRNRMRVSDWSCYGLFEAEVNIVQGFCS